jgi:DNA-binding beta-propeller fold protein YncE
MSVVDRRSASKLRSGASALVLVVLVSSLLVIAPRTRAGTGDLTFAGCVRDQDAAEAAGCVLAGRLKRPAAVAASADGKTVYVLSTGLQFSPGRPSISVFAREPETGALRFTSCIGDDRRCVNVPALDGGASDIVVSKDGRSVYVTTGGAQSGAGESVVARLRGAVRGRGGRT